jgi:hypothetical protein
MKRAWLLVLSLAALLPAGCGGQVAHLDGTPSDGGSSNPNSSPDAIAPGVSIVIEDQETAIRIAVDETRLYWLSRSRVRSCKKGDCAATIVTYDEATVGSGSHREFYELAVGSDHVHWASLEGAGVSILSCPSAGCSGAPRVVATDVGLTAIAVDETHVYWASLPVTAIMRRPLTGAGTSQVIAPTDTLAKPIVVDATHVYWIANAGLAHGAVKRVAKQGGEPPVTLVMEQNQASSLALDAEFFYWANSHYAGTISRCPLSGCVGAPTMIATGQTRPKAVVTDGRSIFWMNVTGDATAGETRAAVMRCPIEACASALETLAVQTFAQDGLSMVIDGSDIYWVAQGFEEGIRSEFFPHATIYRHSK